MKSVLLFSTRNVTRTGSQDQSVSDVIHFSNQEKYKQFFLIPTPSITAQRLPIRQM